PLEQVRPGERRHEQRVVARPVEQVLDEVEQARVCPLHVLENEDGRVCLGEPLEEDAPRGEQILAIACLALREAEEMRETRLDERALLPVEEVLDEGRIELL